MGESLPIGQRPIVKVAELDWVDGVDNRVGTVGVYSRRACCCGNDG